MAEQGGKPSVKAVARLKVWRITRRLVFLALFSVIAAANPPASQYGLIGPKPRLSFSSNFKTSSSGTLPSCTKKFRRAI